MIHNLTRKTTISRAPVFALGFWERGRGMIGRNFGAFDAMVFQNCGCIHTMFMSVSIDVIFVDRENRICGIRRSLCPWIPFAREGKAVTVIEMPDGAVDRTGSETGDIIDLSAVLTEEAEKKLIGNKIISPEAAVPLKGANYSTACRSLKE